MYTKYEVSYKMCVAASREDPNGKGLQRKECCRYNLLTAVLHSSGTSSGGIVYTSKYFVEPKEIPIPTLTTAVLQQHSCCLYESECVYVLTA